MPVHVRHPVYFRRFVIDAAEVRPFVQMVAHSVAPGPKQLTTTNRQGCGSERRRPCWETPPASSPFPSHYELPRKK